MRYAVVAVLMLACSMPFGIDAATHPSWEAALARADAAGLLVDRCRNADVVYRVLTDEEAKQQGMPSWACGMTVGRIVRVRESCIPTFSEEWILEHEFLHAVLACSEGGVSYENANHEGPEWDGLRVNEFMR